MVRSIRLVAVATAAFLASSVSAEAAGCSFSQWIWDLTGCAWQDIFCGPNPNWC